MRINKWTRRKFLQNWLSWSAKITTTWFTSKKLLLLRLMMRDCEIFTRKISFVVSRSLPSHRLSILILYIKIKTRKVSSLSIIHRQLFSYSQKSDRCKVPLNSRLIESITLSKVFNFHFSFFISLFIIVQLIWRKKSAWIDEISDCLINTTHFCTLPLSSLLIESD